jgi:molecular chaperone DnaK
MIDAHEKPGNLIGIDLGTTYSSLCRLDERLHPVPIPNREDGELDLSDPTRFHSACQTPSVVFIDTEGEGVIVGRRAVKRGEQDPDRCIANAKRFLSRKNSTWTIDGVSYTAVDVAAMIIRQLLANAEKTIGPISEAVVSVPAHFTAHQRKLTEEAALQAGLERISIVNEPIAAALDYALGAAEDDGAVHMSEIVDDFTALVFDLGGGTCDLAVIRYGSSENQGFLAGTNSRGRQIRVVASAGEPYLGGIDWDLILLQMLAESFEAEYGIDPRLSNSTMRSWVFEAEQCKCRLSDRAVDSEASTVDYMGREHIAVISRVEYERRCKPLIAKAKHLTERLLKTSDLTWKDIDRIIPVGGSIRLPAVRDMLEEFASQGPVIHEVPPDLAVAQGDAMYAGCQHYSGQGSRIAQALGLRDLSGVDMSTISGNEVGIIVVNDEGKRVSHTLIPRNTELPVTKTVKLATKNPNQTRASIRLTEGDWQPGAEDNCVCTCRIQDLPSNLPVNSRIEVEVTYGKDGLLEVLARHRDTGKTASACVNFISDSDDLNILGGGDDIDSVGID